MRYLDVQLRTLAPGNLLFAIQSGVGLAEKIGANLRFVNNDLISNASLDELCAGKYSKVQELEFMNFCSKLGIDTNRFTLTNKSFWNIRKKRKLNGVFRSVQHENGIHQRIRIKKNTKTLIGSFINPNNFGKSEPIIPSCTIRHRGLAIHVRGGDYLTGMKGVYNLCDVNYYRRIIDNAGYSDSQIHFFTNDPSYAKFIKSKIGLTKASINCGDEIDDLFTMAEFESIAITNSSYSWWSAHIGSAIQIFAPNRWRNDQFNTADLIMPSWNVIDV
ncbi:alpha-1,2-fucosyltransferase [Octadecabacter sp.]|nr:alpha-1,2-fucosyltransferase [Octadecabacter sp.]